MPQTATSDVLSTKSEQRFDRSSPRGVASAKRRALNSVNRNIAKVEARLTEIGRRASRDVKALIIDGNNLCYQDSEFIGLAALKPLCTRLATTRDVTVVFDSSIRRHLQVRDDDLRRMLPDVAVHVVAPRRAADETILDSAQDGYVYVISNDRFGEFREKAAVREDRLLRHEIINGRVLVHDLWVDETFATGA